MAQIELANDKSPTMKAMPKPIIAAQKKDTDHEPKQGHQTPRATKP